VDAIDSPVSPGAAEAAAPVDVGTPPRENLRATAWPRIRAWGREHAAEILLYTAARIVGLAVLVAMASRLSDVTALLGGWDGSWYLGIARHGYDTALTYSANGSVTNTNVVFFPLYPGLIVVVGAIVGPLHAALLISFVSGLLAAVAMRCVGEALYDKRTGVLLAVLWGILPTAVIESMAYTESLYTALAAFTVLFLVRERWIAAGVTALFAGLTHPTGVAAAATVGICAIVAVARRRAGWRPWLAVAFAPLGALGYLAWVGFALGRWDGFTFMEEHGWDSSPSLLGVWRQIVTTMTNQQPLGYYVPIFVLLFSLLFAVGLSMRRLSAQATRGTQRTQGLPVLVFAWASIALALFIGPTYFHAEARFLMPDFPILLPPAVVLSRLSRPAITMTLVTGALLSAWYGGYLLTVWAHSP
jgi:hypothetical protein